MASSGPGDSDWFACDEHASDYPYFGMIYSAQLDAMFSDRPVPKTREECALYTEKYLSDKKPNEKGEVQLEAVTVVFTGDR